MDNDDHDDEIGDEFDEKLSFQGTESAAEEVSVTQSEITAKKKFFHSHSNTIVVCIVGLPNVGKSTLFNLLNNMPMSPVENELFTTTDPFVSIITPYDSKLDYMESTYLPEKIYPCRLTVIDTPAIVTGSAKGACFGLPSMDIAHHADIIIHLLRGFESDKHSHYLETLDPARDAAIVQQEMLYHDLQLIEHEITLIEDMVLLNNEGGKHALYRLLTLSKAWEVIAGMKRPDPKRDKRKKVVSRFMPEMCSGKSLRSAEWDNNEIEILAGLKLWTTKEVLFALNVARREYLSKQNKYMSQLEAGIVRLEKGAPQNKVVMLSLEFEDSLQSFIHETAQIDLRERFSLPSLRRLNDAMKIHLDANPTHTSAIPALLKRCHKSIQIIHFYTCNKQEIRVWCLRYGKSTSEAAGLIDTRIHRNLIRGDVIGYDDYLKYEGDLDKLLFDQKIRNQGKKYVVNEGDIIEFKYHSF